MKKHPAALAALGLLVLASSGAVAARGGEGTKVAEATIPAGAVNLSGAPEMPARVVTRTVSQAGATGSTATVSAGDMAAAPASQAAHTPVTNVGGSTLAGLGLGSLDLTAPRALPVPPNPADRFMPHAAGTVVDTLFYYGPYTIPAGSDLSRPYSEIPLNDGFLTYVRPALTEVDGVTKPAHADIHIHHAHWFEVQTTSSGQNYSVSGTQNLKWIFGTGQEETAGGFEDRTKSGGPTGPTYGEFIDGKKPQLLIYMIHNETSTPQTVYMTLHVHFTYGTADQIKAAGGPQFHNLAGILLGNTFDVPRNFASRTTSVFKFPHDANGVTEWVSDTDGMLIGVGGHLHQGGMEDVIENMGSKDAPCPNDGKGIDGGTTLLHSRAIMRSAPLSEDFQMSVTRPGWRAPIHKGDRIRVNGVYENSQHAWYWVMNHIGFYIDPLQATTAPGVCAPGVIDKPGVNPVVGVPNREWDPQAMPTCGFNPGDPACDVTEPSRPAGISTPVVHIADFKYLPGDLSLGSPLGGPAQVKKGSQLTFINDDQAMGSVRHTVTTCPAPCNGPDYANYPDPNGILDSGVMGNDWVDGGTEDPHWATPATLDLGHYVYFCRIHPWMRGAFDVLP